MMNRRLFCLATAGTTCSLPGAPARAQAWPSKPLRIVTPFGAGQGPEVLLRLVAERLQAAWAQPVVVENKPGASGFIAFEAARQAPADGHTLVNMDSFHIGTQPHLFKKLPYDAFKDFTPVTPLVRNFFFLVVAAGARWKSVGELIAAARARPAGITYGSWGVASPAHLGGALLEAAAGLRLLHVPYKEPSQLYGAVATGEVDFAYGSAISAKALLEAGRVRLLAVAAPRRTAGFEQVPTVAESGGPAGFELGGWNGLLVPAGTPPERVARLNEGVRAALASPELRSRLGAFTYEDFTMSPSEMAAVMQAELKTWGPTIQRAGIRLEA